MKKLLLAISLLISSNLFAAPQKDTVITITDPGGIGRPSDKGWKFHAGDDPQFARSDYDDHNWESINPIQTTGKLPPAAQRGIGWLRLHFQVADSLRSNTYFYIYSNVAIEIYLNGRLIGRRGSIDAKTKTGRGYLDFDTVSTLPFTKDAVQVLAIRYAHQPVLQYFNSANQGLFFSLNFSNLRQRIIWDKVASAYRTWMSICMSALILLALLHLVFLFFNRSKKANLYFAGYAFFNALFVLNTFYTMGCSMPVWLNMLISTFGLTMAMIGSLCGLKALYSLYDFKPGRLYKWLMVAALTGTLMVIFDDKFYGIIFYLVFLFIVSCQVWLAIKGLYYKKRGAGIIATGFAGSIAGAAIAVHLQVDVGWTNASFFSVMPIAIGIFLLSPAFGMSLFLSREFALDSRLLAIKLDQVEQLSAANLAQEQEKQQLLADQNVLLEQQVSERTAELNQSLTHLKSTQTQLIQSEKMASLGELTAGIAHEIQNPLNFVNNFSEVNRELIDEMQQEMDEGHYKDAKAISGTIKENEEKIGHHGKRADAIVKGMLQHSQSGAGTKEPTNINALVDECMRLAYHGLRAKDKSFNAEMVSQLDETLPAINVIPQDMVRVMLNLFNNAFYAVNQKAKMVGADYQPEVSLTTLSENGRVVITVRDNGVGIPDAIKDKIMQPFFTTKPTGEGTGLGLSLTYDMVVKGHGGSIQVNSIEGEGSEFIIQLPVG